MGTRPGDRDFLLPVVAALVMVVGSVGPWVAFHGQGLVAFDTSRRVVSLAGAAAGLLALLAGQRGVPASRLALAGCALVGLGFSGQRFVQLLTNDQGAGLGWGIWMAVAGSVLLLATAALRRRD